MDVQTKKMKVLLVSDRPIVIEGLRAILGARDDLDVIGEAHCVSIALNTIRQTPPDIVISDLILPASDLTCNASGVDHERVSSRLLMLSKNRSEESALHALMAGAAGYLPVDATSSDLVSAIAAVREGNYYVSDSVALALVRKCQCLENRRESPLTERAQMILKLIIRGSTTQAIAEIMGLSITTVKAERRKMMRVLRVRNMIGLIKLGIQRGIGQETYQPS